MVIIDPSLLCFLNRGLSKTFCGFTRASRQHQLLLCLAHPLDRPPPTAHRHGSGYKNNEGGCQRGVRKYSACVLLHHDGVWEFSKRVFEREIPTHDVWQWTIVN